MMIGPLILLAASASPANSAPPGVQQAELQPVVRATAHARVSIRIIAAVRFGADQPKEAIGADRRSAWLTDASGTVRPAELLEFQ